MCEVYVYYRLDPDSCPHALIAARQVIADIAAATGIAGHLLEKQDQPGLLMEIYRDVSDPAVFCQLLQRFAADRFQKQMAIQPDRHVEIFRHLPPETAMQ
ncbi:MAG: DUF4936 family protein [Chitinivorax sp.]|jgi:hypothetical protein